MPKKIQTAEKQRVSQTQYPAFENSGWCVAGVLVVCSGVLVAKWAMTDPFTPAPTSSAADPESGTAVSSDPPSTSSETPEPEPQPGNGTAEGLRAVTIDTALLSDTVALDAFLGQAAEAGFNSVC